MNRARGEVVATLAGAPRILCLTLGAIAAILAVLDCDRLETVPLLFGRMTEQQFRSVLVAMLQGGGETRFAAELAVDDAEWSALDHGSALAGIVDAFDACLPGR